MKQIAYQSQAGSLNLFEFPSTFPFTLLRNLPEHLNVTTLRGLSIIESPVAGFLPFRSFFSFTQNLPNPLTRTSSPDARVDFIISISCSTNSVLFFCGKIPVVLGGKLQEFHVNGADSDLMSVIKQARIFDKLVAVYLDNPALVQLGTFLFKKASVFNFPLV
jgi:hypothetical protein